MHTKQKKSTKSARAAPGSPPPAHKVAASRKAEARRARATKKTTKILDARALAAEVEQLRAHVAELERKQRATAHDLGLMEGALVGLGNSFLWSGAHFVEHDRYKNDGSHYSMLDDAAYTGSIRSVPRLFFRAHYRLERCKVLSGATRRVMPASKYPAAALVDGVPSVLRPAAKAAKRLLGEAVAAAQEKAAEYDVNNAATNYVAF